MGRTAKARATLCPVPAAHSSHLKEITPALPDARLIPILSSRQCPVQMKVRLGKQAFALWRESRVLQRARSQNGSIRWRPLGSMRWRPRTLSHGGVDWWAMWSRFLGRVGDWLGE
jgi:hypothetical protein